MIKDEILGGLKSALIRGYSLEEAMFSFYNAGYKKEDIEEAARQLQIAGIPVPEQKPGPIYTPKQNPPKAKPKVPEEPAPQQVKTILQPIIIQQAPAQAQKQPEAKPLVQKKEEGPKVINAVSSYEGAPFSSRLRLITMILIIILIILLAMLGIIFAFKTQIIQFFNSLF